MFRWYVVNTYSGHENKVKHNLEHRIVSLGQQRAVRNVVVPTEAVAEMKDNQKVTVEKRTMPGYVLVNMELHEASWGVVKAPTGSTRRAPPGPPPARRSRSASRSRSFPDRSRTSPARSPRSTRTPRGS